MIRWLSLESWKDFVIFSSGDFGVPSFLHFYSRVLDREEKTFSLSLSPIVSLSSEIRAPD